MPDDILARMLERDRALVEIADSEAMAAGDVAEVCRLVTRASARMLDVQRVNVWLLVEGDAKLSCLASYRLAADEHRTEPDLDASDNQSYFEALASGRALVAHDARSDPRTSGFGSEYLDGHGIGAMLDTTIRLGGRVVGVVCHEHVGGSRQWRPADIAFATAVADLVAQASLNAARAEASASVRQLEEELEVTRRHEALGRLAGGVIHDLNNLLFCVIAYADLLRTTAFDESDHETLVELRHAAGRAAELARELLAFGARSRGDDHADIVQVVSALLPLLRRLLPEDVELVSELPPRARVVQCTRGAIEQVLMNLVVNARDAVGTRGRIEIRLRWVDSEADAPIPTPAACLRVRDDGPGITPEVESWIFQPFFSTKPAEHGTGLGLSTVKGLVEAAGGVVRFVSSSGRAEFEVWLPAVGAQLQPTPEPAALAGALPIRRGRALVADADPDARWALVEMLRREGFETVAVEDAEETLAVLRALKQEPAIVVVDASLPGLERHGLASLLAPTREAAVLLVSARPIDDSRHAILAKPFGRKELGRAISRAFLRARRRDD